MVRLVSKREERDYVILPKKRTPIGPISGAKRDFEMELTAKEPDMDDFRAWLLNMDLKDEDFYKKAEDQWKEWTDKEGGLKITECDIFWTGQSHIDIAWEWTLPQTIEKSIVTYGKAVYHGEKIPNFIFAGSQALTYEFVRQRDPELFSKIQEMHKKGHFELVGGSWVEPDCRMPNGEGFIRERLYGQHYYMKYFNTISKVEWTPDTFGYAWNMPQIIRKSGGEYFFTTKVWGNNQDYPNAPWPFTNFIWEGPDKSKILTHIQPQMFGPIGSWPNTKKKSKLVKKGKTLIANYLTESPHEHELLSNEPNDYVRELGVFYGLGDGGHGPTGKEVAVVEHFLKKGRGKYRTIHDYFNSLDKYRDRLPIWNDELYFQQHHGTLTTQALVKKGIRMLEWRTAGLEAISTLLEMIGGNEVPYADLTQVWKDILTNHFHDIFPGSSIPEVYDDTYDHFQQDFEILNKIQENIISYISDQFNKDSDLQISEGIPVILINPLGFKRKSIVTLPINAEIGKTIHSIKVIKNNSVHILPVQFVKGDIFEKGLVMNRPDRLEFIVELDGFEISRGFLLESECETDNIIDINESDSEIKINNADTLTTIDKKTGNIVSCKWKDKELFGGSSFELKAFCDMENVWEIQSNFRDLEIEWELVESPHILENGPVRIVIDYITRFEDGDSDFKHRLIFYNGMNQIVSEIIVDWKDPAMIIKMKYDLSYDSVNSISEIPAAIIKRRTKPETSHDKARWENNCQSFVEMPSPDDKWGIAFINDSKYGFTTPDSNIFELTLLRKARYPKVANEAWVLPERRARIQRGDYVPTTSDEYSHVIRQVIVPHDGTWDESGIVNKAHAFNSPIIAELASNAMNAQENQGNQKDTNISKKLLEFNTLIQTSDPRLEILALKVWEPLIASGNPGYILRIVNNTDKLVHGNISFDKSLDIEKIIESDLLERPITETNLEIATEMSFNKDNGILEADWSPFSIRTFILK